jgi:homoserine kinase
VGLAVSEFRIKLPATSANLGAAFDTAAVALDFYLTVEASAAESWSIRASGRNIDLCSKLEGNLILDTYAALLQRERKPVVPLALRVDNQIPLGMGCGSSAAGRLAAITLATHFGQLPWESERILSEACDLEGHPDNAAACWLGGMVVAAGSGANLRVAQVEPPSAWRALVVMPGASLATSEARAVLPATYSRQDAVANIQAASLLGLAFAQGRGDLLQTAMADRIHQPYRAEICSLLPLLLPLAGRAGILGVALSGAGPSILSIVEQSRIAEARNAIVSAVSGKAPAEILEAAFAHQGGVHLQKDQHPPLVITNAIT